MKNVFIVGARGYKENYGGWETFVTSLVDNYNDTDTHFYITNISDNCNSIKFINDNITVISIKIKNCGSARMFLYTLLAYKRVINYINKNKLSNCYIYVLGLKLGFYMNIKKKYLCRKGITTIVNPDGLEWKRSKWSYPVKKFFLMSEKWMLNACDIIVCDAKGIKEYVDFSYPKCNSKTRYIAYGSEDINISNVSHDDILNEYKLEKYDYCLMVGRCVPENNYELVINDFMKSNINKKLVIISNLDSSDYSLKLKSLADKDERIIFINGVYDKVKLSIIRKYAFLYIHGHSVGGTNPSLLEALRYTDVNVLYDVNFNHDIGLDSCLYFKNDGDLTSILNDYVNVDKNRDKMSKKAKKIINDNYTWDIIVSKYKEIFK